MGIFGVLLGTVLLFVLAYIGWPVMLLSMIAAAVVAVFNGMPVVETITSTFMAGAANSFTTIFGMLVMGGILAQIYKDSGGASSIANGLLRLSKKLFKDNDSLVIPITVIVAIGFVICYGGINGVVSLIIMFPICMEIMKNNNIPRYMGPGIILGATCTAAMTSPGSPQSQNSIPGLLLKTSSTSGLIPGVIAGIVVVICVIASMTLLAKREIKKGNGWEDFPGASLQARDEATLPNVWVALIPLIVVFALYNVAQVHILVALTVGDLIGVILFWKNIGGYKKVIDVLTTGANDSCSLGATVCFLSGFGAVISAAPAFNIICQAVLSIPGPVEFKALISMMIVVAVAGSGPGGMLAGIPMFAETFAGLGLSMSAFHRIAAFTGTCLDTLPSNGAVAVGSRLSGYPVSKTYFYCFMTTVLSTTIGAVVVTVLLAMFPQWA